MREQGVSILTTVVSKQTAVKFEKYLSKYAEEDETLYFWFIYQAVGLIIQGMDSEELKDSLKNKKVGWESPTYKKIEMALEEYDNYIVIPFEVVDGVVECTKCGGSKTWSIQKQLRGGDEPMTTFSRCVTCGNSWKYSG